MSLTSFLRDKGGRELFNEFKKPRNKILGEIKAPPLTNHYTMVGTAFDYLLRFYLKYHNPGAKENIWIAEKSCTKPWRSSEENLLIRKKAGRNLEFAKNAYTKFLKNGIFDEDIYKSVILLAQLDPIIRANYVDENLGIVDNDDIQDLKNLISLVNIEDFKVKSHCFLNPNFGEGSSLIDGADGDLVIDNQIIDIKTTKKLEISKDMFNQIIGYYVLAKIGGITIVGGKIYVHDENDPVPAYIISDQYEKIDASNINEIGFYFSRYGIKYMYKVEEIIDINSLPNFISKFKNKAKELFPQSPKRNIPNKSKHNPEKSRIGKEIFSINQSDIAKISKQAANKITKWIKNEFLYSDEVNNLLDQEGSLCFHCKHYNNGDITCKAFPSKIPEEIITGKDIHISVISDQKGSFVFELSENSSEELILKYFD